jgi:hypothetical protein
LESESLTWDQVLPKLWEIPTYKSPPRGPFHDTYTSRPLSLVVISGLSVHATCPCTGTGFVQVLPWSVDLTNAVDQPLSRSILRNTE